jgi:hypothetical protein
MRLTIAASLLAVATVLAACAGGDPAAEQAQPAGAAAAAPTPGAAATPAPASTPTRPTRPPATGSAVNPAPTAPPAASAATAPVPYPSELAAHAGLRVDCQADTECAVKDVGNCCGRYDACVRADSQPDPAAVQAECAAEGGVGICGFPVIEACVCSAGTCQAAPSDGGGAGPAVR